MGLRRIALIICCAAVSTASFVILDFWSSRNAPLYKRFERKWAEDIETLEASGKLPKAWQDVAQIEIIGGTAETKKWLRLIEIPLKTNPAGKHRMDVLIVAWEEEGIRGVMLQYNIEDQKTKNTVSEFGRTLLLNREQVPQPVQLKDNEKESAKGKST